MQTCTLNCGTGGEGLIYQSLRQVRNGTSHTVIRKHGVRLLCDSPHALPLACSGRLHKQLTCRKLCAGAPASQNWDTPLLRVEGVLACQPSPSHPCAYSPVLPKHMHPIGAPSCNRGTKGCLSMGNGGSRYQERDSSALQGPSRPCALPRAQCAKARSQVSGGSL